ncbi:DUF4405 domain-containing protein [Rhizobium sp. PAMB 3182]
MPTLFQRYATPFTTGLFLVSLISGIALFFHYGSAYFHGMHEWLSMVLIAPFLLHIWKNWRPFVNYLKRPPMAIASGLSLAAAIAFAVPAMTETAGASGNPMVAISQAITGGTVADVAPLFGHTPESLATALQEKGLTVTSADSTIADVAKASGVADREMMSYLASSRK